MPYLRTRGAPAKTAEVVLYLRFEKGGRITWRRYRCDGRVEFLILSQRRPRKQEFHRAHRGPLAQRGKEISAKLPLSQQYSDGAAEQLSDPMMARVQELSAPKHVGKQFSILRQALAVPPIGLR